MKHECFCSATRQNIHSPGLIFVYPTETAHKATYLRDLVCSPGCLGECCKYSSNMALPGLSRGPRTPAPPQTAVHKRLLDSEASQSCNSTAVTICTTCHNINKQCSLLNQLTYDYIYIYIYIYVYKIFRINRECLPYY